MIDTDHRKAGMFIARHLLPRSMIRDQQFWSNNWDSIQLLPRCKANLTERILDFSRSRSRTDALSLVGTVDTCWQLVRGLSGRTGSDQKWLEDILPNDHGIIFPIGSTFSYVPIEITADNIRWVYGLSSSLRHPSTNAAEVLWMTGNDPWREPEAERLLATAKAVKSAVAVFEGHFGVGWGWADDLEAKKQLARRALKFVRRS